MTKEKSGERKNILKGKEVWIIPSDDVISIEFYSFYNFNKSTRHFSSAHSVGCGQLEKYLDSTGTRYAAVEFLTLVVRHSFVVRDCSEYHEILLMPWLLLTIYP